MPAFSASGTPLQLVAPHDYTSGLPLSSYTSPDGRGVRSTTNLAAPPFSDDFGTPGSAVDLTRWDVLPGGLGANPSGLFNATGNAAPFTQAAIGSGISTGISYSQSASNLNVVLGTTLNAELWFLSRAVFAASENVTFTFTKSQAIAANDIFIGLVEVDPSTGVPLLNPNAAGEFTNRGGVQLGATTSATTASAAALGDSSPSAVLAAQAAYTTFVNTVQEWEVEVASEDVIVSQSTADNAAGKNANVARASSQCPNDSRVYKLLMRFKNVSAPASSTTCTMGRIIVECKQSMRVVVDSGNGDQTYQKAIATNVVGTVSVSYPTTPYVYISGTPSVSAYLEPGSYVVGGVVPTASATVGGAFSTLKLLSAATTNATAVKTSPGRLYGGQISNFATSPRFLKLYNKTSAPVPGTDVPALTIVLPGAASASTPVTVSINQALTGDLGVLFNTGIGFAITGAVADADTTAIAAGDVLVNLLYV